MKKSGKTIAAITAALTLLTVPSGFSAYAADTASSVSYDIDREEFDIISTPEELMNMKPDGKYYLKNDIDLSGVKWRSIHNFTGFIDANGFEIKNLTSDTYGLFCSVGSGAVIKNITLTNVNIMSKYAAVGGIVSLISKDAENVTVDNCFVSGVTAACRTKYHLDSESTAGAIVGKNNSKSTVISNCYSNAVVCSEKQAGGIVGINFGTVKNCAFGGTIENSHNVFELAVDSYGSTEDDYAYLYASGGICGINYGTLENCLGNYTDKCCGVYNGGIAGIARANSKITKCVNLTPISCSDDVKCGFIAGFAYNKSQIEKCFTINPTNTTTLSDIGFGKSNVGVTRFSAGDTAADFSSLGHEWEMIGGVPVLRPVKRYFENLPSAAIKGGRLVFA